MTTNEAIIWLNCIRCQFKGNDTIVPINDSQIQALELAIKALNFYDSQRICCDNCSNKNTKSEEVCTSPYGRCRFYES